jgi:hypothetical protein
MEAVRLYFGQIMSRPLSHGIASYWHILVNLKICKVGAQICATVDFSVLLF